VQGQKLTAMIWCNYARKQWLNTLQPHWSGSSHPEQCTEQCFVWFLLFQVWPLICFYFISLNETRGRSSVSNGSVLPGCGPRWNRPDGPGPGQEPPSNLNQVTSAGLLPGPDIYPRVFGRVGTGLWFLQLWLQLSIWVLIVSRHEQYVDCAVLTVLWPPTFRFVIRLIFVKWLRNTGSFEAKFAGFQLRLKEYWSDRKSEIGRWKRGWNCTFYVLSMSQYDQNSHTQFERK